MKLYRRVVLESPYAGDKALGASAAATEIDLNVAYARRCVLDCLRRGESPSASHLLFTQPGVLDDAQPEDRDLGIQAGLLWAEVADAMVVYVDRGISGGMRNAIEHAEGLGITVEYRTIGESS